MSLPFACSLFFSALLLFIIQPMTARQLLPVLGGTASVWISVMLFFQAMLFAGYAYSFVLSRLSQRFKKPRLAILVHVVLLALSLAALPVAAITPPESLPHNPAAWLFAALFKQYGLIIITLSATAPLLQHWFAGSSAKNPYALYVASNLGSMAALLGYPLLLEPVYSLGAQTALWQKGFYFFAALASLTALLSLWRIRPLSETVPATRITAQDRLAWVGLAFVPSSLLLGLTSFITTDVAPTAVLWLIPLAFYLLSFVIVFANRPLISHNASARMHYICLFALIALGNFTNLVPMPPWNFLITPWFRMSLHVLCFFAAALMIHHRLNDRRPAAEHLTEFYVWMALGGALGGVFNSLVAPLLFNDYYEYLILLCASCLLRPGMMWQRPRTISPEAWPALRRGMVLDVALPLLLLAIQFMFAMDLQNHIIPGWLVMFFPQYGWPLLLGTGMCILMLRRAEFRPVRLALLLCAMVLPLYVSPYVNAWLNPGEGLLYKERTYFGVLRVVRDKNATYYVHGNINHGMQWLDADKRLKPTFYYEKNGPLGQLMSTLPASFFKKPVAVIGLGAGAVACHAEGGQQYDFFEVDDASRRIAEDVELFTYLRDCNGTFRVTIGDGRQMVAKEPDGKYGMLIADAFNGNAIPVHLLTKEAVELYLTKLDENGIIAFDASNNYLNMQPILGKIAASLGLYAAGRDTSNSSWLIMARNEAVLAKLGEDTGWKRFGDSPDIRLWTDDFSDLTYAILRQYRR